MDEFKHAATGFIDGVTAATVLGALFGALPNIAALLGVIWWGIRIWETETIKRLTGRWDSRNENG